MKFRAMGIIALMTILGLGAGFPATADAKRGEGSRVEQQLTPEQQAKYKKIIEEGRLATADMRKEMENKRAELQSILQSENPDKGRIEALSTEIGALRGRILSARVDTNAELKKEGLPTRKLDRGSRPAGKRDGKGNRPQRDERPEANN